MYTKAIQDCVAQLPISESIKEELASDKKLEGYKFYVELASVLAPLFPRIHPAQLQHLTVFSYLYFRYILNLDCVLDGEISKDDAGTHTILAYQTVHEVAVRGLAKLFPEGDSFWLAFSQCKQDFLKANVAEKRIDAARGDYSQEQFEHIASGKAAVCYAMIHALCSLGQDWDNRDELIAGLSHMHIGDQYFDDVVDFLKDDERRQYSYPHHLVEQFMRSLELEPAEQSAERKQQFLYTSGIATLMLENGIAMVNRTLETMDRFGLTELSCYLKAHIHRARLRQGDITRVLDQAKQKVAGTATAA